MYMSHVCYKFPKKHEHVLRCMIRNLYICLGVIVHYSLAASVRSEIVFFMPRETHNMSWIAPRRRFNFGLRCVDCFKWLLTSGSQDGQLYILYSKTDPLHEAAATLPELHMAQGNPPHKNQIKCSPHTFPREPSTYISSPITPQRFARFGRPKTIKGVGASLFPSTSKCPPRVNMFF